MKEIRFINEARIEFLAAVTYDEQMERGLGVRFRNAVEAASALAARLPNAGSQWKHGTHRVFTKKRTLSSSLRSRISDGDQSIGMVGGAAVSDVGYFVAGKNSNLTPYQCTFKRLQMRQEVTDATSRTLTYQIGPRSAPVLVFRVLNNANEATP